MNAKFNARRRTLLKNMIAVVIATLPIPVVGRVSESTGKEFGTKLVQLLKDQEGARRIGRVYLDAYPADENIDFLVSRIQASCALTKKDAEMIGSCALRKQLGTQVRRDFESSRTVVVDGWILSRTEARLCAVCALS